MPEITIDTTPETKEESEVTWESALSELSLTLLSGFSQLREEMAAQRRESGSRISSLLESNTQLTQQITTANQTLMDKLALLTPIPLPTPEVVVVAQESDVVAPEAQETVLEEPAVEEQAPVARPKRRTL